MKSCVLSLVLLLVSSTFIFATSIIPYPNLGEMSNASDAVVIAKVLQINEIELNGLTKTTFQLEVEEVVHGALAVNDNFTLAQVSFTDDFGLMVVDGDIDLALHQSYCLFLHQSPVFGWQPLMLSYGILEEHDLNGKHYLVPSPESLEMHLTERPDGKFVEPLVIYEKAPFLNTLSNFNHNNQLWGVQPAITKLDYVDFGNAVIDFRTIPTGCDFLGSSNSIAGFRWQDTDIGVYYSVTGDLNFIPPTSVFSDVQSATNRMNEAYQGLELFDGGIAVGYTPACASGAISNVFITFANLSLGGPQSIFLQFNDPCAEIPDLNGCSGVLAFGGSYASGNYQYRGETFASSLYGYVVMNNNILCVGRPNYEEVLIHEMTHSMGMAHLNPTLYPSNNMNPSCCSDIGTKDTECMDYLYEPIGGLAVDVLSFDGKSNGGFTVLNWETSSEFAHDRFEIESAQDGKNFVQIGKIKGNGTTALTKGYAFKDYSPVHGKNYYRLKMIDEQGQFEYSETIVVAHQASDDILVFPNPTNGSAVNVIWNKPLSNNFRIDMLNASGQNVFAAQIKTNGRGINEVLSLPELAKGMYILRFHMPTKILYKKLMIH